MTRTAVRSTHTFVVVFAVIVVLLLAADATACPVCQDANEKNREAFVYTTWLLSFTPLAMIAGIATYVWKKAKGGDAEA